MRKKARKNERKIKKMTACYKHETPYLKIEMINGDAIYPSIQSIHKALTKGL